MSVLPTKNGSGVHWTDKVNRGQPPKSSTYNAKWSEYRREMEKDYFKLAADLKKTDLPSFPWMKFDAHVIGNFKKTFWMHLQMCSWKKIIVNVEMSSDESSGFLGILGFVVPADKLADFNAGFCPVLSGYNKDVHKFERKTIIKHWREIGFREQTAVDDSVRLYYDRDTHERMKGQIITQYVRSQKRRQIISESTAAASVTTTPVDTASQSVSSSMVAPSQPVAPSPMVTPSMVPTQSVASSVATPSRPIVSITINQPPVALPMVSASRTPVQAMQQHAGILYSASATGNFNRSECDAIDAILTVGRADVQVQAARERVFRAERQFSLAMEELRQAHAALGAVLERHGM